MLDQTRIEMLLVEYGNKISDNDHIDPQFRHGIVAALQSVLEIDDDQVRELMNKHPRGLNLWQVQEDLSPILMGARYEGTYNTEE